MDIKKIEKLIKLLDNSTLSELEISEGSKNIRLSRKLSTEQVVTQIQAPQMQVPQQQIAPLQVQEEVKEKPKKEVQEVQKPKGEAVKSPMVGTFYSAASPDNPPFVKVGDSIKVGQTLCIIEAMKIMNQIEAEKDGIIAEVLLRSGDPVEYGQALFTLA